MLQVVPMTVEQALKAAETYSSPINGSMVDVLASEVKRLRRELRGKTLVTDDERDEEIERLRRALTWIAQGGNTIGADQDYVKVIEEHARIALGITV